MFHILGTIDVTEYPVVIEAHKLFEDTYYDEEKPFDFEKLNSDYAETMGRYFLGSDHDQEFYDTTFVTVRKYVGYRPTVDNVEQYIKHYSVVLSVLNEL